MVMFHGVRIIERSAGRPALATTTKGHERRPPHHRAHPAGMARPALRAGNGRSVRSRGVRSRRRSPSARWRAPIIAGGTRPSAPVDVFVNTPAATRRAGRHHREARRRRPAVLVTAHGTAVTSSRSCRRSARPACRRHGRPWSTRRLADSADHPGNAHAGGPGPRRLRPCAHGQLSHRAYCALQQRRRRPRRCAGQRSGHPAGADTAPSRLPELPASGVSPRAVATGPALKGAPFATKPGAWRAASRRGRCGR